MRTTKLISVGVLLLGMSATLLVGFTTPALAQTAPNGLPESDTPGLEVLRTRPQAIPVIAERNRISTRRAEQILAKGDSWVSPSGGILFSEPAPGPHVPFETDAGPYPYDQTFLLHSRPGSNRTIYLDFNGATVSGTTWMDGGTINAPAYDLDGNQASFTNAEMDGIQYIWQRVTEAYSPFDIDVTTEPPTIDKLDRSSTGDATYGTRIVVTSIDPSLVTDVSTTGVAYLGSFDETPNHQFTQPAWSFTWAFAGNNKRLADVTIHELGHTLGLSHDGTSSVPYYQGNGLWGPIMGATYTVPIGQFSQGEYPDADNFEDDLSVIASHGGTWRVDDHPNVISTATPLVASSSGVVTPGGDYDTFRYTATTSGNVTFNATPSGKGPMLDINLTLYSGTPTQLATANPPDAKVSESTASGMDASITYPVTAGVSYYLQVGPGSYLTPTTGGFSTYGSIGSYVVSASAAGQDGDWFHPVNPARILDSRPSSQVGAFSSPWGPGAQRDVQVAGLGGVPSGADAVVLNVTVTNTTASSFLSVWPAGQPTPNPLVSSLNWTSGLTIPNAVTAKVGANNKVTVFNAGGNVDVVIDVVGYYDTNPGDGMTSVNPARVLDSRASSQVGAFSTPWGPGAQRDVQVAGLGGVPSGADAVVLNVTVTNTTASSFLSVWPAGQPKPNPLVSSLNWTTGLTIPNAVTAKVGANNKVTVFNAGGNLDVVIDVVGYFATGTGKAFHPLNPARIQDSRPASQVGAYNGPWGQGTTRGVAVTSTGGVPATGVDAVLLNVTVTNTTAASFLSIWPGTLPAPNPLVSSLNWLTGRTIPNAVTAKVGANGALNIYNPGGNVDVIADVSGWYG